MVRFISRSDSADRSAYGPQLQVIGAGLSRCATSSLKTALESSHIGYFPCMHMEHVVTDASRLDIVYQAMHEDNKERRQKLLHKIFDGYQATTDFPGFWFIDDLMDMYPDAAIVLNQRSGGGSAWFKSWKGALGFFETSTYYRICFLGKINRLHHNIHQAILDKSRSRFGADLSAEFYDVYQDYVLREAEKRGRKVLIWKAEDGWEPLCQFLGQKAPVNEPFPWVNEAANMMVVKRILVAQGIISWISLLGGMCGAYRYGPKLWAAANSLKLSRA